MKKSPRHLAALAFAEQGIPIFPCGVNSRLPAIPKSEGGNGFHDSTCEINQINEWWARADFNVGLCPEMAGWCVVDLDEKNGKSGISNWAKLGEDSAPTYTVRTPTGGRHLYYEGSLPSTVEILGPGIDTRGRGGYVLVPPSIIDGKSYEVINDVDLADCPRGLAARLERRPDRHNAPVRGIDERTARSRARVLLADRVRAGNVAIEGRGGDSRTYALACELLELGCSQALACELLEEIWNPHCVPPWTSEELESKVENAARYIQNEAGAWAVPPAAEVFGGHALDKLVNEPAARSRFHAESEDEQEQGRDPSWIIEGVLPEASTALLVGQTGSFKTFVALDMALSIAAHVPWGDVPVLKDGPVFYAAAEGRHALKKLRRRAWKALHQVEAVPDFFVMPMPLVALADDVNAFGDEIARRCEGRRPALIVLDTVAKAMAGLNENDASDIARLSRFCDSLVDTFGCTVLGVAHQSDKEGAAMIRGSSALRANFDSILTAKADRTSKAVEVRVEQHKDADEPEDAYCFEGVTLGQSLAFHRITPEEYRALVKRDDLLDPRRVGGVLQRLGAYGPQGAVTSHVLAAELAPAVEKAEDRENLVGKVVRLLGKEGRSRLEAYCVRSGRDLMWFLPSPTAE